MRSIEFTDMDTFIADVTARKQEVMQEAFPAPPLSERPGSAADREMRAQHAIRVEVFRMRRGDATAFQAQPQTYKKDPARFAALVEKRRSK